MPRRIRIADIVLAFLTCGAAALPARAAPPPDQALDQELRAALIRAVQESDSFDDRFDAEVWLVDMSNRLERFLPEADERLNLLRQVHREAKRVELPPEMVLAVIEVESAFDRFAVSTAGAQGLMQVMPFWLDEIGRPGDNLFHVKTNLRLGCTILRHYFDKEQRNWQRALQRYNGERRNYIYSNKVFRAFNRRWFPR